MTINFVVIFFSSFIFFQKLYKSTRTIKNNKIKKNIMSSTTLPDVAKMEYTALTDFQKSMHFESSKDEEVRSLYSYDFVKSTWTSPFKEQITRGNSNPDSGVVEYILNDAFDYIKSVQLSVNSPMVRVLPEYTDTVQVCLCHNFTHNVVKDAKLYGSGGIIQNSGTIFLDYKAEADMRVGQGMRELSKKMVGDRKYYGIWSTILPSFKLGTPLKFYHSGYASKAMPLFLKDSQSKFIYRFTFETNVSELVRMRVRTILGESDDDEVKYGEWKYIKYNPEYVDENTKERIDLPILWGRYSCIGEKEKEWRKTFPHEYYTEDMILIPSDSEVKYGYPCAIQIQSVSPAEKILVIAKNIDSENINNHSNYSTNTNDIDSGWNPIESISMMYGTSARINEMDSMHFDAFEHYYGSKSAPEDPGWNVYHFSDRPFKIHPDVGVSLYKNNPKIVAHINDTNPFTKIMNKTKRKRPNPNKKMVPKELLEANDNSNNLNPSPSFKVYVILIIIRKIIFEHNKKVIIKRDNQDILDKIEQHYLDSSS